MYIDHIIYSSWVSARIKCGFTTDSKFAGHLLSLEQRRQGKIILIVNKMEVLTEARVLLSESDQDFMKMSFTGLR